MKKLLAKWLGLYTERELGQTVEMARSAKKIYYESVLKQLHQNGTIPPNCDIKMPKLNVILHNAETEEVVAENGKWQRLPADGEVLKVGYKDNK